MNRILAIALNTFREAVRDKVLYGVVGMTTALLAFTLVLAAGEESGRAMSEFFLLQNLGLAGTQTQEMVDVIHADFIAPMQAWSTVSLSLAAMAVLLPVVALIRKGPRAPWRAVALVWPILALFALWWTAPPPSWWAAYAATQGH